MLRSRPPSDLLRVAKESPARLRCRIDRRNSLLAGDEFAADERGSFSP
jgi:hypothetical protein